MANNTKLTIGIISRNGEPFIVDCLKSFESATLRLLENFAAIDYVLVDSDSSDKTLQFMLDFAQNNNASSVKTTVYLLEGYCNAAIARNVILKNSQGDQIFLCDGDVVVNPEFLISASQKIHSGKAEAVIGPLAEKWYDNNYQFYKSIPVRNPVIHNRSVRIAGGMIFLSKKIMQNDIFFDERFDRNEDRDFSLRISEKFKILGISEFVGTHLTQPYFSTERFSTFIRDNYNKYIGMLLKKHLYSPSKLFEIFIEEKGVMLGFVYMLTMIISILVFLFQAVYVPLLTVIFIMSLDFLKHFLGSHVNKFFMHRLVSPVMTLQGFFCPIREIGDYVVKKII